MDEKSSGLIELEYSDGATEFIRLKHAWFRITKRGRLSMWARGKNSDFRVVAPLDIVVSAKQLLFNNVDWNTLMYDLEKNEKARALKFLIDGVTELSRLEINFKKLDLILGRVSVELKSEGSICDEDLEVIDSVSITGTIVFSLVK